MNSVVKDLSSNGGENDDGHEEEEDEEEEEGEEEDNHDEDDQGFSRCPMPCRAHRSRPSERSVCEGMCASLFFMGTPDS